MLFCAHVSNRLDEVIALRSSLSFFAIFVMFKIIDEMFARFAIDALVKTFLMDFFKVAGNTICSFVNFSAICSFALHFAIVMIFDVALKFIAREQKLINEVK